MGRLDINEAAEMINKANKYAFNELTIAPSFKDLLQAIVDERRNAIKNTDFYRYVKKSISERWQANLGLDIFLSEFTRGLTAKERTHIRGSVSTLYDEMAALPAWRRLPSVTGYSAFDLFDIYPQRAHAYVYVPKSLKGPPQKAVIFFHGSLGSLKAYPYLWAKYAEKTGALIICPTAGFGNWNRDTPFLDSILQALPKNLVVPRENTILVGLSAGGVGVINAMKKHSDYRAAVFVSAVFPDFLFGDKQLTADWDKKPFIVVHGLRDFIIPVEDIRGQMAQLADFNPSVQLIDGESHFLMLTNFESIERAINEGIGGF